MHYTIERLSKGDASVVDNFVTAKKKWEEIFESTKGQSIESLTKKITEAQMFFEHHCGGRHQGQEIMVWSSFGTLYSVQTGFEADFESPPKENYTLARDLAEAFQDSSCSMEVKVMAREAAKSYLE